MSKINAAGVFAIIVHFLLSLYLMVSLDKGVLGLIATNIHFTLGMLLLMMLLKAHLRYNVPLFLSAPSVFLLIHCNYFILSSLKYFTIPSYISFKTDIGIRALGSLVAIAALFIGYALLVKWLAKQTERVGPQLQTMLDRKEALLLIPALIMALPHFWGMYKTIRSGQSIDIAQASYSSFVIADFGKVGFITLLMTLAIIAFKQTRRKEWNFIGIILLIIFFLVTLFLSMNVGARHMIYFVVIAGLIGYSVRAPARAFSFIILLFIAIEVAAIVALGPITSMFSSVTGGSRGGRNWSTEQNIQGLTYRSDLSDFAISMAMDGPSVFGAGPAVIKDSVIIATPRLLNPGKFSQIQNAWDKYLMNIGWLPSSIKDYPDTFISTGYVAMGWPGMLLLPAGCMFVIMVIQNLLYKWRRIDPLISLTVLVLCSAMFFIEIDIHYLIFFFRRIVLVIIAYYVITRGIGIFMGK